VHWFYCIKVSADGVGLIYLSTAEESSKLREGGKGEGGGAPDGCHARP